MSRKKIACTKTAWVVSLVYDFDRFPLPIRMDGSMERDELWARDERIRDLADRFVSIHHPKFSDE